MDFYKSRRELHDAANELRKMTGEEPIPWIEPEPPFCSFCGKGKNEYRHLVQGPSVYICDECIMKCVEIINENELDDP